MSRGVPGFFVVAEIYVAGGIVLSNPAYNITALVDNLADATEEAAALHEQTGMHTYVIEAPVLYSSRQDDFQQQTEPQR